MIPVTCFSLMTNAIFRSRICSWQKQFTRAVKVLVEGTISLYTNFCSESYHPFTSQNNVVRQTSGSQPVLSNAPQKAEPNVYLHPYTPLTDGMAFMELFDSDRGGSVAAHYPEIFRYLGSYFSSFFLVWSSFHSFIHSTTTWNGSSWMCQNRK